MIHYHTETNPLEDHYAVAAGATWEHVLIQIQENGTQVRIPLTALEARHLAKLLTEAAETVES